MKSKILKVLREYADMERCYEIEELAESICKELNPSYSTRVKINAMSDGLFHGETFVPERDEKRLRGQLASVYNIMKDECWYTLSEIKDLIGKGTESAISARIRDFKKMGMMYEKRHLRNGLWQYRLIL